MRLVEFYDELFERHQDIGKALEYYYKLPDVSQYYFTYTDIDKVGINPKYSYDTPLGVYAYPLEEMYKAVVQNEIPFAGTRKHLYVLKAKAKVTSLYAVTSNEYNSIAEKAYGKYSEISEIWTSETN